MVYTVKRFSSTRKAVVELGKEAKSLLSKGYGPKTKEGQRFLIRAGRLSSKYQDIANKGKALNPLTWRQSIAGEKAAKETWNIYNKFYK